jgi:hypothetical protein
MFADTNGIIMRQNIDSYSDWVINRELGSCNVIDNGIVIVDREFAEEIGSSRLFPNQIIELIEDMIDHFKPVEIMIYLPQMSNNLFEEYRIQVQFEKKLVKKHGAIIFYV